MKDINYAEDLKIDQNSLDLEWLEQPGRMMTYCQEKAGAERELDRAKQNLDVVRAEIKQAVRADPDKYGLEKITEGALEEVLVQDEDYQHALEEVNDKKYELGILEGAVRSFDQRKKALESLVTLHGQQYFAGPSTPVDINRESLKHRKKEVVNEKIKGAVQNLQSRRTRR